LKRSSPRRALPHGSLREAADGRELRKRRPAHAARRWAGPRHRTGAVHRRLRDARHAASAHPVQSARARPHRGDRCDAGTGAPGVHCLPPTKTPRVPYTTAGQNHPSRRRGHVHARRCATSATGWRSPPPDAGDRRSRPRAARHEYEILPAVSTQRPRFSQGTGDSRRARLSRVRSGCTWRRISKPSSAIRARPRSPITSRSHLSSPAGAAVCDRTVTITY
jgi:hypothetical protein